MAVTVAKVVEYLKANGERDAQPNPRGNAVYRTNLPEDRYVIDFAPDFTPEGWQQFDTDQDAHYFGVWVNKAKRLTLTYAEGDWVLVECPTAETYRAEILGMCEFFGEGMIAKTIESDRGKGIPDLVTTYRQDRAAMFLE
jgi:hypothetical protein